MTKKAFKEALSTAPKYIVYIDYKAGSDKGTEIKALSANDIFAAMDEAEQLKSSDVYLMRIAESTSKVNEYDKLIYVDRLCTRSANWYCCNPTHGENVCEYSYQLEYKYFDWERVIEKS